MLQTPQRAAYFLVRGHRRRWGTGHPESPSAPPLPSPPAVKKSGKHI